MGEWLNTLAKKEVMNTPKKIYKYTVTNFISKQDENGEDKFYPKTFYEFQEFGSGYKNTKIIFSFVRKKC